jgi:hypothetical protein
LIGRRWWRVRSAVKTPPERADNPGVKAILSVVVYLLLVAALGIVTALTVNRDNYASDGLDDEL